MRTKDIVRILLVALFFVLAVFVQIYGPPRLTEANYTFVVDERIER
jgi:hypothetical protein